MLEGDEALAFKTYEVINTVVAAIKTNHWLNLTALVHLLPSQDATLYQSLMSYGKQCLAWLYLL